MEKEILPEHKQYVGKLYRDTEDAIGKIINTYFEENGELRFKGHYLWFDDENYSIDNGIDEFKLCDFEIISQDEFLSIYDNWTKQILLSYGIKV